MKTSVAIVTFNRSKVIGRTLEGLMKQSVKPNEIMVVDSSTDKKTRNIAKKFNKVKYIHTKERIFQPEARNLIIKKCKGDIIAFLDDDAVPEKEWLENIIAGYANPKIVGVTGPAINTDENLKPLEKIIRTEKNQNFFTFYGDIRCEARRWIPKKPTKCSVMLGANMSFRAKYLKEVGGFDEKLGRNVSFREEMDPQIKLIRRGYIFLYMPGAYVSHVKYKIGGIRSNKMENYYYWCGVNHKYFVDKYFSRLWTRLSWLTISLNPPSVPVGLLLSLIRRDLSILKWYKGLFRG